MPILTPEERDLLGSVCSLIPISEDMLRQARGVINRRRPTLPELSLASQFPDQDWLARLNLHPYGLEGEIGLALTRQPNDHWLVCVERLPICALQPDGPGIRAVVDGPFEVIVSWDALAQPEQVGQALAPALAALRKEVAARVVEPELRDRCLQALTAWPAPAAADPARPDVLPPDSELQGMRNLFGSLMVRCGIPLGEDPLARMGFANLPEGELLRWREGRLQVSPRAAGVLPAQLIHPLRTCLAEVYEPINRVSPRELHRRLLEIVAP